MDETTPPERLNPEGFAAYTQRARQDGDGPVVMLNLLALKPDGGRARYEHYAAATAPFLERVGGRIVYAGESVPPLLGDDRWDLVALVEYPSRQAFLDMIGSPEYQAIAHLRTEALTKGELHPLDTVGTTFDR
ncbi:MAG TPA: DUF1330 domain-containing protein [Conexibacter sp.]|jgi:uncharacterized protein (DUF1330 family)|nr:DUF1330 domain-containing protein [Conexibacter sp.]